MVQFRTGSAEDIDAVLALFDTNVAWLVERGRSDQWGSEPFSEQPKLVEFVRDLLSTGLVTIAEIDGAVVGASVVTDHPMPYVPPIAENERYLKLLIVSPAHRGQRIGHRLIELARDFTRLVSLEWIAGPVATAVSSSTTSAKALLRCRRSRFVQASLYKSSNGAFRSSAVDLRNGSDRFAFYAGVSNGMILAITM